MELTAIIEALLIASEPPLSSSELARLVRARVAEADEQITVDNEDSKDDDSPKKLPRELAKLATTSKSRVIAAIESLNTSYQKQGRSFTILERSKGWKIYTNPEYADFVRLLFPGQKPQRLSGPAMETLAIIAYRQPITKASMEAVRGVSCDGMIQKLLDRSVSKLSMTFLMPRSSERLNSLSQKKAPKTTRTKTKTPLQKIITTSTQQASNNKS